MIIGCPTCLATFSVPASAVPEKGRTVKCSRCANSWLATPDQLMPDPEAPQTVAPDTQSTPAFEAKSGDSKKAVQVSSAIEPGEINEESLADIVQNEEALDDFSAQVIDEPDVQTQEPVISDAPDVIVEAEEELNSQAPKPSESQENEIVSETNWLDKSDDKKSSGAENTDASDKSNSFLSNVGSKMAKFSGSAIKYAAVLLLFILSGYAILAFREPIVKVLPGSASFYAMIGYPVNVRGLEFANLNYSKKVQNGLTVLTISGDIVNVSGQPKSIPQIRFGLQNETGHEIYHWISPVETEKLDIDQKVTFETKLASPPKSAKTVKLRFSNARRPRKPRSRI